MPIIINIPDQLREDLIVTAIEGGSNYWYYISTNAEKALNKFVPNDKINEPFSIRLWIAVKAGAKVPIRDAEDPSNKIGELSIASIEKGEQLLANNHMNHLADILGESWDAISADVWFQYCTLGEIVYG